MLWGDCNNDPVFLTVLLCYHYFTRCALQKMLRLCCEWQKCNSKKRNIQRSDSVKHSFGSQEWQSVNNKKLQTFDSNYLYPELFEIYFLKSLLRNCAKFLHIIVIFNPFSFIVIHLLHILVTRWPSGLVWGVHDVQAMDLTINTCQLVFSCSLYTYLSTLNINSWVGALGTMGRENSSFWVLGISHWVKHLTQFLFRKRNAAHCQC